MMEEALLQLIRQTIADKQAANKLPAHALRRDIMKEVKQALDNLRDKGITAEGDTINDTWIIINNI